MPTELRRTCPQCDGTGQVTPPSPASPGTCPTCTGIGRLPTTIEVNDLQDVLDDILSKLDDILDKCNDILEAL